jgi:hypothetical protein
MTADEWVAIVDRLEIHGRHVVPTVEQGPCWHALAALDAADAAETPGAFVWPDDPMRDAARLEWLAVAAVRLRVPKALAFAQRCHALRDDLLGGLAA